MTEPNAGNQLSQIVDAQASLIGIIIGLLVEGGAIDRDRLVSDIERSADGKYGRAVTATMLAIVQAGVDRVRH